MVGPALQATGPDSYFRPTGTYPGHADSDSLMNQDPGAYWGSDNMPHSGLASAQGDAWASSPRIVRIPIYNPDARVNGGLNTPSNGASSYQPLDFVGFWVQDIVYTHEGSQELGTIVGRFVTVSGLGTGTGGSGPGNTGSPVLNIRLVE